MSNSSTIPSPPRGAPKTASLPAEAITLHLGDAVVAEPSAPHSLHELRDAIKAETANKNKQAKRVRELKRFGSHLPESVTDLRQITIEHVTRWWTGMGTFSVASGQERLKALVAVFDIAKDRGWITVNHAQAFRDAQNAARKLAASQGGTAPADAAGHANVDVATVAPTSNTPDKEAQQTPIPSFQVEAPLPAGPAAADPAQAALAAAEAKKRARAAEKRALMVERLKLTPRARCAACEHLTAGCKRGLPARWAAPDQEVATCLVTGHSRSTLRKMTDSQNGAPPEVKANNDKGQRIIDGPDYCRYLGENEIKGKATA